MPFMKRINQVNSLRVKKRQLQVTHADLTAAATSEAIDIGSAFGDDVVVLGCLIDVTTLFSGGSVSAITAEVGIDSGDTDAMMTALDVFTGAATGKKTGYGVGPAGWYGGIQPSILFSATGDNVVNLTAGDLTVTIYYIDGALAETTG